ncbi:MAG TPA: hypothetical protein VII12_18910 [Thermoanaerobaculia bacterium]
MKFRLLLLTAALALPATASDDPFWRSIDAEISLEADGSVTVTEKAVVENPSGAAATIKHRYWTDSDEKVQLMSILPSDHYKFEPWGELQLNVPPGVSNYVITSRVTGVVTPIFAVPRGVRSMNPHDIVVDPRDRIREILPFWRDHGDQPRSRYLLDYQFFFPDQQQRFELIPSISFGSEWKPVHPIKPGGVGSQVKAISGYADSYRIRHLFDYTRPGAPAAIDLRAYEIRSGSIVAFPIAAALIWLVYVAWVWIRSRSTKPEIDERWLRENVFNQPPEIVRAQWSGWVETPEIEEFLRRLEKADKITLDIEKVNQGTDDEEEVVSVRLRVDRSHLSDYERAVIDALMPQSDEITSRDIKKIHAGTDFDPMDAAGAWLRRAFPEKKRTSKPPVLSRLLSFLLFAGGAVLLGMEAVRGGADPIPFVATLVLTNFLVAIWPTFQKPSLAIRLAFIPLILLFCVVLLVQTITNQPAGIYASVGAMLMTLGGFHIIVSNAAKSDRRPAALVDAREWFRNQTHIRDEWLSYVDALGLQHGKRVGEDESWGYALCTFTE